MKNIWTGALLTAGLILTTSVYGADPPAPVGTVSARDTAFVQTICDDSLQVQRIGEMTHLLSQNTRVQEVGQKQAQDYAVTRQQFAATAQTMGVSITSELSGRAARAVERLQGLSGAGFDKAALHELVASEQAVLRKIQDESAQGDNPALKVLAASTLSHLQDDVYKVVILESDLNTATSAAAGAAGRGLASEP
jgi:predicted outer membrane protein